MVVLLKISKALIRLISKMKFKKSFQNFLESLPTGFFVRCCIHLSTPLIYLWYAATGGGHITSTKLPSLTRRTTVPSLTGFEFVLRMCTNKFEIKLCLFHASYIDSYKSNTACFVLCSYILILWHMYSHFLILPCSGNKLAMLHLHGLPSSKIWISQLRWKTLWLALNGSTRVDSILQQCSYKRYWCKKPVNYS
jgi:hypothetical protein